MDDMRIPTQSEIVTRFQERRPGDFFGFETRDYIDGMDFDHAKALDIPQDHVTATEWNNTKSHSRQHWLGEMLEYMEFAWDKANGFRSVSAMRSIQHYIAWTWLAGDSDFSQQLIDGVFAADNDPYGKDTLIAICKHYGWEYAQWDDGYRGTEQAYHTSQQTE